MKSLVILFIFIAAVKSGKVDYEQVEASNEETNILYNNTSNESLAEFYEKYGEERTGYEPYDEILDESILDEPYETLEDTLIVSNDLIGASLQDTVIVSNDVLIDDSYYRGGFHGPYHGPLHNKCLNPTVPISTSYVTVTTTNLWLNTVTHASFHLIPSVETVRVTATECSTTITIITEPPLTVTSPSAIEKIWETVTDTKTRVVEKFYTNCLPTTETRLIYVQATELKTECSTVTDISFKEAFVTNWWTHTLTLHKKIMVSTVSGLTVTNTDHITDIEYDTFRDYYTVTEEVYHTEFNVIMISTTSTLWVTHALKTDCW